MNIYEAVLKARCAKEAAETLGPEKADSVAEAVNKWMLALAEASLEWYASMSNDELVGEWLEYDLL